jgi:hypothetical protein
MPDIRSSGIFADSKSGGGAFQGSKTAQTTQVPRTYTPGAPIDAISHREVGVVFHDFVSLDDIANYVVTNDTSGTALTEAGSVNGAMILVADTVNQGLVAVQHTASTGARAHLTAAANRIICFEARVSMELPSQNDWFIGIGEIDSGPDFMAVTGAILANGADNHIGFHHIVANAGVPVLSSAGVAFANVQPTSLGSGVDYLGNTISVDAIADATTYKFGFRLVGTTAIEFYLDDELVHVRTSDDAFAEPMTPTICLIGGAADSDMTVDYIMTTQTR